MSGGCNWQWKNHIPRVVELVERDGKLQSLLEEWVGRCWHRGGGIGTSKSPCAH